MLEATIINGTNLYVSKPQSGILSYVLSDYVPHRVDIYIGSDNSSRKIGKSYLRRVQEWADRIFPEGYTLLKGNGYYQGVGEESIIINVFREYDIVLRNHIEHLKQELRQKSILVVKSQADLEVV